MRRRRATVATPGEWQCKIWACGGSQWRMAQHFFEMLLVAKENFKNISLHVPMSLSDFSSSVSISSLLSESRILQCTCTLTIFLTVESANLYQFSVK